MMAQSILIAGNESPLSTSICAEAVKRSYNFVVALIPNRLSSQNIERSVTDTSLKWNPGSPISARTVVLAAENRLKTVPGAVLVCSPPSIQKQSDELVSTDIETMVNDHIKGWFFLVKELTALFKAKGSGTLALVLADTTTGTGKNGSVDLLYPSVIASFRAFAQSLLSSPLCDSFHIMGFYSDSGEESSFAPFIFKILDDPSKRTNGKWHKYSKLSIFGR
ncbi:MAG: hypothetical protein LBQ77_01880 [Treponema sp.]|jgi:hypothetical protein|nr:hypothetical protein [Treponema sp.]